MKITHIGSLPFIDNQQALAKIARFDYFTIPEFIQAHPCDSMLNRSSTALDKSDFKYLLPQNFEVLLEAVSENPVMLHICGPATFCMMFATLERMSKVQSYWQLIFNLDSYLKSNFEKLDFYLCLDEPSMNFAQPSIDFTNIYEANLNKIKNKIGIHCCDDIELDKLFLGFIDFLSVPLFKSTAQYEQIQREYNLELFLGVIDSDAQIHGNINKLGKIPKIIFTPFCGLGTLSVNQASLILDKLEELKG